MEKNDMIGKIAIWAFIIGLLVAVIVGIWQAYTLESDSLTDMLFASDIGGYLAWILAILGVIVGVLAFLGKGTITKSEVPAFLTAGIALLVMYGVFNSAYMFLPFYLGSLFAGVSLAVAIFIAPAAALLAIKAIWDIGKSV